MFIRARIYAVRNSDGNSSGNASCCGADVAFDFFSSGVSGAGGFISVGCMFAQIFFTGFGTGMVTRGFFVRMINVVVAMYNGNAASSSIPNTKPGNPFNLA